MRLQKIRYRLLHLLIDRGLKLINKNLRNKIYASRVKIKTNNQDL